MADFVQDFRFALRLLRKSRVATAVAVASLALGIGCTTAAFSLVEALLLRPLPALHAPETLVAVGGVHPKDGPDQLHWLSFADYLDYAGSRGVVSGLAAGADCDLTLLGSGPAERIAGLAVSANYFSVLGLRPARGRLLSPADETAPVAVLGYGLWQRRFGGNPAVIGSGVTLNGKPFTIAGVAPEGFLGTDLSSRREVWLPLGVYSQVATGPLASLTGKHDRKQEWLSVFGRLAPGVSLAKAQSALGVVAKRLAASYPEDARRGVRVLPLSDLAFGSGGRRLLVGFSARLLAVAALVLAVAAINVAGLLLARSLARRQEIAVRLSLGASPRRLVRQLFSEGLVLALLAAALGAALATLALPLLEQLNLPVPIAAREVRLSWRMLGFALLVALLSSLVFALVPALQAVRASLLVALRGTPPRVRGLGLREILAGAQVALALLILIASGLMVRTLANLRAVDPGFDPEHVLVLSVDLAPAGYKGQQVATFYRDLLERLRRLPGIEEASMASALPVIGNDLTVDLSVDRLDEKPAAAGAAQPSARHVLVGSRYFQAMKTRLVRGRDFSPEDSSSGASVVIVNETAAHRLWGGRDPLGRRVRLADTATPFEIVGVVADTTYGSLREGAVPILYLFHGQQERSFIGGLLAAQMTVLVRTSGAPLQALGAVRETVRTMDARLPVFQISTLQDLLAATVGVERQAAALYSGLALIAMTLAMLGLYGVLTYRVTNSTREIGIRIACGAGREQVWSFVLRRSLLLVVSGVAAGLALALAARRVVASQLYGIAPLNGPTWIVTTLVLMAVALLVSIAPARRAMRIDPAAALRSG